MAKVPLHPPVVFRLLLVLSVLSVIIGIGSCTTTTNNHTTTSTGTPITKIKAFARVTIPRSLELFEPFILTVQPGTAVTWQNNDTTSHTITTTPDHSNFLNPQSFSLNVAANNSATFIFTRVGLYHYYEKTKSTWNATLSRVAANQGVPRFPLAMDGIIWVQGPISDPSPAAFNYIPKGHDDFELEFLAIRQTGSVTWHNFDEDPHFVGLAADWSAPINPADIGLYRIAGTDDVPGGESVTVLFDTPGLYYYYCRNHDRINAATHRAQALLMASDYPIPMEGFVLVAPN